MIGGAPGYIIAVLAVYFFIDWQLGNRLFTLLGIALSVNAVFKNFIAHDRPYRLSDDVKTFGKTTDYEFDIPSGHAQISGTVWGAMARFFQNRFFTVLALSIILLTGLSRIYLGFHSPEAILAGYGLAVLTIIIEHRYSERIENHFLKYRLLPRWVGCALLSLVMVIAVVYFFSRRFESDDSIILYQKLKNFTEGLGTVTGIALGRWYMESKGRVELAATWFKKGLGFFLTLLLVFFWVMFLEKTIIRLNGHLYYLTISSFLLRCLIALFTTGLLPRIFSR